MIKAKIKKAINKTGNSKNFIYLKIQTNRVSLVKFMRSFSIKKTQGENFVAPRPAPGELQMFYIGYLCLKKDSTIHLIAKNFKKHTELNKAQFDNMISKVKYSWPM